MSVIFCENKNTSVNLLTFIFHPCLKTYRLFYHSSRLPWWSYHETNNICVLTRRGPFCYCLSQQTTLQKNVLLSFHNLKDMHHETNVRQPLNKTKQFSSTIYEHFELYGVFIKRCISKTNKNILKKDFRSILWM